MFVASDCGGDQWHAARSGWHAGPGGEFLYAGCSDDFGQRCLNRNSFLNSRQKKFPGELTILQVFGKSSVPIFATPRHKLQLDELQKLRLQWGKFINFAELGSPF